MNENLQDTLSRRSLLSGGLGAALLAGTGTAAALLSACSRQPAPADGYYVLHSHHIPMLQRMTPAVIGSGVATQNRQADIARGIHAFDQLLADTSPAVREIFIGLLDLLTTPLTRGPVFGLWRRWEAASEEDARLLLDGWEHTSFGVLKAGYNGFTQLVAMSWYLDDAHVMENFYPGPPRKIVIEKASGVA